MISTYLLQRLKKPVNEKRYSIGRAFSKVSMSEEAWEITKELCEFDYMGAAEYEFGTINTTMHSLAAAAQREGLSSFSFVMRPQDRKLNTSRQRKQPKLRFPAPKSVRVMGICQTYRLAEIREHTKSLCSDEYKHNFKRGPLINSALDPIEDWETDLRGWIDLDNDYMFFCDEDMWRGFCSLLQVDPCLLEEMQEDTDYTSMLKPALVSIAVSMGMFRTKAAANKLPKQDLLERFYDA